MFVGKRGSCQSDTQTLLYDISELEGKIFFSLFLRCLL